MSSQPEVWTNLADVTADPASLYPAIPVAPESGWTNDIGFILMSDLDSEDRMLTELPDSNVIGRSPARIAQLVVSRLLVNSADLSTARPRIPPTVIMGMRCANESTTWRTWSSN